MPGRMILASRRYAQGKQGKVFPNHCPWGSVNGRFAGKSSEPQGSLFLPKGLSLRDDGAIEDFVFEWIGLTDASQGLRWRGPT